MGGGHVFDLADALRGAGHFRILSTAGGRQLVAALVGVGRVAGVVRGCVLVVVVLGGLLTQQVAALTRVAAPTGLVNPPAKGTRTLLGFQGVLVAH